MEFFERLKEINAAGWILLNCFQLPAAGLFRVNLQFQTPNGASTEYFSAFADAADPGLALESAFANTKASGAPTRKIGKLYAYAPTKTAPDTLTPAQEKRLERAFDNLYFAVKMSGAGS